MKRNLKRKYKLFECYDSVHNKTDYIITKFKLDEDKMNKLVNEKDYYELCDYFEVKP